jgi:transglutaminase-like putative cysteine protease
VTYTLNISFIDEVNVDRLAVFTPSPRNWSSQTNAVLLDCVPKTTCVVKYDPLYGNNYIYYDKTSLINNSLSITQEFQFTCYEINTCFENIKDIYEYDKNSAEFKLYTRDEPEIETNYFKDIVKSVIGDEKNPVEICRKIYNFVINYMTYGDIHQPGGAKNVYINKKGDCGGYSTLFVALTRAAGIPARVVVGGWSNSTTDKYNNWHVWAEFYLEKIGWIPVDPSIGASNDNNRSYYFGNLDNNRYIASKGLNIPLGEYNPVLFQTCCWWWWGNWTKFEEPKTLLNLTFEEVKP